MPFATERKPSKVKERWCIRSVAIVKESIQLGCVSQDSYPRKFILREQGKLKSKHTVIFSTGTQHQIKNREKKGPSRGIIQNCAPHERRLCAPKFEERTLHQEGCARRAARDLANICTSSRHRAELRSIHLSKQW